MAVVGEVTADESFTGGSIEPTVVSFSIVGFLGICSAGLVVEFTRSWRQLGLVGVLGCEAPRSLGNLLGKLTSPLL